MDYRNGKIYTIRNNVDDEVYVGATCSSLTKRFCEHKRDSHNTKFNRSLYVHMRLLSVEHFYIELHEVYPCENRTQLRKREGEVIKEIGSLNKRIAGRSREERYVDCRDEILLKSKEYSIEHKDEIRLYRDTHKNEIQLKHKIYCDAHKDEIQLKEKLYRDTHKDEIQLKRKTYRDVHKIEITLKNKVRVNCPSCEKEMNKASLARHMKKFHQT